MEPTTQEATPANNGAGGGGATQPEVPRRGRPKGSKNRPKEVIEAEKAARQARKAEREGQKRGDVAVPSASTNGQIPVKRGPGRPKGSKNKPKVVVEATHSRVGPEGIAKPLTVSIPVGLLSLIDTQAHVVGLNRSAFIALATRAALANGIVATRAAAGAYAVASHGLEKVAS